MQDSGDEIMLAQEQGVLMRGLGIKKELEGEFGAGGETEGTLVLTSRRLIYVATNEQTEDLPSPIIFNPFAQTRLIFSDVEDIQSIPADPRNLFIQISAITSVKGRKEELARPKLEARWRVGAAEKGVVFTEVLTGRSRKKNLNDWAVVVERLKSGKQKILALPSIPGIETLEGKIMRLLADAQERGALTIEEEVETAFKIDLQPDEVEDACEKLVSQGALLRRLDSSGDAFYRKRSPLGTDDLSA